MTQTDLVFIRGSATSEEAAESIEGSAATLRLRVLTFIKLYGPVTDEEIANGLGMNPSTARPRRIELVNMGRVVETGERKKNKSGRSAVTWRAR